MNSDSQDIINREEDKRYREWAKESVVSNSDSVEAILTKLENTVEHDLKMRMGGQPQRLKSPKQVHLEAKAALDKHYTEKFIEILTPEPQHADYNPEILKAVQQRNLVKTELQAKIKELWNV